MLMAVLSAAVGAAFGKLGQSVTWDSTTGTPLCLETPSSWYWEHCGPGKTAWAFGSNLLQDSILSLICASAIAAGVLGGSVTTFALAARAMGLSPRSLASDAPVPGILRAILDKPYDIATFLR